MKYIDADRLKKEVKRLERAVHKSALGCVDSETRKFHEGKDYAYQHVGILIDSLPQELPDVHYTKRNELFDKCVENCDPAVMKEVSDNVDKLKSISTLAEEDWFKISEEWEKEDEKSATECDELEDAADDHIRKVADAAGHPGWDWTTQDIAEAFKAGAEWRYQKDRYEFAKLKAKEWMSGYDEGLSKAKED